VSEAATGLDMRLCGGHLRFWSPEKKGDQEGHECPDGDAPGELHLQTEWPPENHLLITDPKPVKVVMQTAENRHREEADHHGDDIPPLAPPVAGQHPRKEDSKQRPVGVPKDPEHNRDDA